MQQKLDPKIYFNVSKLYIKFLQQRRLISNFFCNIIYKLKYLQHNLFSQTRKRNNKKGQKIPWFLELFRNSLIYRKGLNPVSPQQRGHLIPTNIAQVSHHKKAVHHGEPQEEELNDDSGPRVHTTDIVTVTEQTQLPPGTSLFRNQQNQLPSDTTLFRN